MINDLGKSVPSLKRVLIDERDYYLAEKIRMSSGNKVVAVVGAGHMSGIIDYLENQKNIDLNEIEKIPPISVGWKLFGWSIPVLIVVCSTIFLFTKSQITCSEYIYSNNNIGKKL